MTYWVAVGTRWVRKFAYCTTFLHNPQLLPQPTMVQLPLAACREMAQQAERDMKLNCTIQEGQIWLAHAQTSLLVEPVVLKAVEAVR